MTTLEATALVARLYRLSAWAMRLGHLGWACRLQERAVIEKREAWHARCAEEFGPIMARREANLAKVRAGYFHR